MPVLMLNVHVNIRSLPYLSLNIPSGICVIIPQLQMLVIRRIHLKQTTLYEVRILVSYCLALLQVRHMQVDPAVQSILIQQLVYNEKMMIHSSLLFHLALGTIFVGSSKSQPIKQSIVDIINGVARPYCTVLAKYGPTAKPIPKNTPYIDTCLPILLGSDVVVIHVCVPT